VKAAHRAAVGVVQDEATLAPRARAVRGQQIAARVRRTSLAGRRFCLARRLGLVAVSICLARRLRLVAIGRAPAELVVLFREVVRQRAPASPVPRLGSPR